MILDTVDRKCTKCGVVKELCEFGRNKDRLANQCKQCAREYARDKYRREVNANPRVLPTIAVPRVKATVEGNRICKDCGAEKPLDEFEVDKRKSLGHTFRCKQCATEYKMGWAKDNHSLILERNRKYRREHPQEYKEKKRAEYCKHRERYREAGRVYYKENKEAQMQQQYVRRRKRALEDPSYLIADRLRGRIGHALKESGKSAHTIELLGCDIDFFKQYLEAQFTDGMTWDNYGYYGWHMDHKTPLSWFDLENPVAQKVAMHYSNVQPLWGHDNFVKGDRYAD